MHIFKRQIIVFLVFIVAASFVNAIDLGVNNTGNNSDAVRIASKNGDIKKLEALLANGHSLEEDTSGNWSPLCEAIYETNLETVKFFIDNGADLNYMPKKGKGRSPLHCAVAAYGYSCKGMLGLTSNDECQSKVLEISRLLVINGANPDLKVTWKFAGYGGNTPRQEISNYSLDENTFTFDKWLSEYKQAQENKKMEKIEQERQQKENENKQKAKRELEEIFE